MVYLAYIYIYIYIYIWVKESKRTHRFSVTLSFAPKRSSDRTVGQAKVLSDERLGAKLRVTENQCVLFDSFTYICSALLLQHWALFAKVDSTLTFLYIYIYVYSCKKGRSSWLWELRHYMGMMLCTQQNISLLICQWQMHEWLIECKTSFQYSYHETYQFLRCHEETFS